LALLFHPDKSSSARADQVFAKLAQAYTALRDLGAREDLAASAGGLWASFTAADDPPGQPRGSRGAPPSDRAAPVSRRARAATHWKPEAKAQLWRGAPAALHLRTAPAAQPAAAAVLEPRRASGAGSSLAAAALAAAGAAASGAAPDESAAPSPAQACWARWACKTGPSLGVRLDAGPPRRAGATDTAGSPPCAPAVGREEQAAARRRHTTRRRRRAVVESSEDERDGGGVTGASTARRRAEATSSPAGGRKEAFNCPQNWAFVPDPRAGSGADASSARPGARRLRELLERHRAARQDSVQAEASAALKASRARVLRRVYGRRRLAVQT
jgi:hypothetical protein